MEKMNPKSFYLTQTSIINCNGTCKKKTLRNQEKQTWIDVHGWKKQEKKSRKTNMRN